MTRADMEIALHKQDSQKLVYSRKALVDFAMEMVQRHNEELAQECEENDWQVCARMIREAKPE